MTSGAVSGIGPALKVAIIGSGPSAFYSAARLLAKRDVEVHMYERLPTPHGLVRYGVAPDHPEVKNVENKFAQVAQDPRFRFFGNVNVIGEQKTQASSSSPASYSYPLAETLRISHLVPHYTHLLLAYGCSLARPLDIPGSYPGQLSNVHSALNFVNWYNGHPAAHDDEFLQSQPWRRVLLSSSKMHHATVIGAGNVALDVARIVLRSTSTLHPLFQADSEIKARAALRETDIPEPVLEELSRCSINHVDIVARRGPAQVAFTSKELREMMDLQGVAFVRPESGHMQLADQQVKAMEAETKSADLSVGAEQKQALSSESRVRKRLMSIIEKGSKSSDASVKWGMRFFQSPNALQGEQGDVKKIQWNEMAFEPLPSIQDRKEPWSGGSSQATGQRLQATGKHITTETDLVVASVGYQATPLEGDDAHQGPNGSFPWDAKRNVIRNRGGQVIDEEGHAIPGVYASGWVARGPVGVIASTRIDANSVVEQMLHDWDTSSGKSSLNVQDVLPGAPASLQQTTKRVVTWDDWLRLDAEEVSRGKKLGKLREKITSIEEMLQIVG